MEKFVKWRKSRSGHCEFTENIRDARFSYLWFVWLTLSCYLLGFGHWNFWFRSSLRLVHHGQWLQNKNICLHYLVIYFSQNKTDIRSLIFVCFDLTVMTILSWLLSSRQPGGCWELRTSSAIGQRMRKHRPASQPFVYFVENRKIQKFFFREKIKCECESTRQFSGSRNKTFEYQGPALRKIVSK